MGIPQSCLLIVDVQVGFINKHTEHIPKLVEVEQYKYDHVAVTRFFNPENSPFRSLIKWDRFGVGSNDVALAFPPKDKVLIIDKPIYSCVTASFIEWLRNRSISIVYVCGVDTDICVTKCAVDLFENGFEPVVLSGMCASHAGLEAHNSALITLRRYIGTSQVR